MNSYITGSTIKELREKNNLTQKELATKLQVSDKTISKWETGKGYPDITLLEPLAATLGVSVAELLSGECIANDNRSGNMRKAKFYVCPICGNVVTAIGQAAISCCGISLPALDVEEEEGSHEIKVEKIERDYYVTMDHPMTKIHYVSFVAYVTTNRIQIVKLYPEQMMELRIPMAGHGFLYIYCNRHGLYRLTI